ncbi:MAG: PP0621 family protein [Campylobacterota bacterium]|nr:PP0621 family protein [Campylobacterota bacterium]
MILKLLLVIGVIAAVYFMFFKKKPIKNKTRTKKDKKSEKLEANDLLECPTCGVYSELGDSVLSNGKYYCSSECASKAL